jgi:hypothetical protein
LISELIIPLQVLTQETFTLHTELLHDMPRTNVPGITICIQPDEIVRLKSPAHDCPDRFGHQSFIPVLVRKRISKLDTIVLKIILSLVKIYFFV